MKNIINMEFSNSTLKAEKVILDFEEKNISVVCQDLIWQDKKTKLLKTYSSSFEEFKNENDFESIVNKIMATGKKINQEKVDMDF
ncbi:hypothetical protein [Aliarcobacter butzleri]|uniref:hypothetical protein n=1 Tax=Aliarcobacter butzleri TaxID=28197 RepID=UPI0012609379|nr:hypothetical protein [Aliarcobacter butzleri]MCT7625028.1 hypothetical protein [Aliarcobacter butzleri]